MQDHPGAPGSARQRNPGTDGTAACGGAAVPSPQAWDHVRSRAVPLHTPLAPDHVRSGAAPMPKASDHNRSHATPMPKAPDHNRSSAAPMPKAPGQVRPRAASMASPRPRWLWPGVRRPECAADHRPLAGSREPAAPGSLAPAFLPLPSLSPIRNPTPLPIKCIPPYWRRPARRLPPRARASLRQRHSRAPPPPARRQPILVGYGLPRRTPPLHIVERGPGGEATPLTCRPCRR